MNELKKAQQLNQKQLGSINLDDVLELEKEKLSQEEYKERAKTAAIFYQNIFEKVIKLFVYEQLKFLGTQAENEAQILFGRGTINGLYLIDEWCKKQSSAAKEKQPRESFKDITDEIPKIGEEEATGGK